MLIFLLQVTAGLASTYLDGQQQKQQEVDFDDLPPPPPELLQQQYLYGAAPQQGVYAHVAAPSQGITGETIDLTWYSMCVLLYMPLQTG